MTRYKRSVKERKLLSDIFETYGGSSKVGKLLKVSKQLVSLWKSNGFVPMTCVIKVSKVLKVPPISLNFKDVKDFLGIDITWEDVKKDCYKALREL